MIELVILQALALCSLTALGILLIVNSYREMRMHERSKLIKDLLDKGYENDKIDLEQFIK